MTTTGIAARLRRGLLLACCLGPLATAPAARAEGLDGRMVVGYQGWFACPGEAPGGGWFHWFAPHRGGGLEPTFDLWPDVSAMPAEALCDTPLRDASGKPMRVYSAQRAATLETHFRWMRQHGLHSMLLARFASALGTPLQAMADRTLDLALAAAASQEGQVFIVYDLTGFPQDRYREVVEDLRRMRAAGLLDRPAWQHHRGRPVVSLFGLGTVEIGFDAAHAKALLDGLRAIGPLTVMGGVAADWRTLTGASRREPEWAAIYRSLDIISPWPIGAYADEAGADAFLRSHVLPDLAETRRLGIGYLPVAWPGFSATNLKRHDGRSGPLNQIPRRCGAFYWQQARNLIGAGVRMMQTANLDEFDEGTAILPYLRDVPRPSAADAGGAFLSRAADGCDLPPDGYLRLAGQVARGLQAGSLPSAP
ncbi:Hypothetical protein HVIM_00069 [Roseomonas mucosa]|uniref:Xylosidase/arabinosidase n=1 Tax=Roseomonas mucosa TaxID=207340 RepID=A0A379N0A7_9PROT|nr:MULTISPECIES: glycoside hydrolase family 71/99-like protein [Roseomonas]MBS5904426.1 hypothetical protein [Acetobacteraceae bacterium]MCG7354615.1 glycoside hydrolase family 71/99-like protein [Roseomonas mucosa]MCG7359505.1 glycoside hydrolase family 71/99-like protein [Roseomonas mucosa]MDT8291670.1 glycoside hydrolase family 71/99-like protein [Roseomonas mucosa]MDT8293007.1 glycoside hydrolase family 71/99-like protein [Roseomonas mucosa]